MNSLLNTVNHWTRFFLEGFSHMLEESDPRIKRSDSANTLPMETSTLIRTVFAQFERVCLNVLNKTRVGCIRVILTNGSELIFGEELSDLKATVCVMDDLFWARLALFSALGAGEGYMYGEVKVDHLAQLLLIFVRNREFYDEMNVLPSGFNRIANQLFHSHIPNTIHNTLYNIQAHYDLGNDMFAGFLDPSMTYSCPIWKHEDDSLEQAQYNKIHEILDKAHLTSNHHVLEIGTGWGALAIEAARLYGCRVTSLTLSKEQKALAEERIKEAGLSSLITVLLCDYRNLDTTVKFDRIITVEMLEAVGPEFLPIFFEKCDQLLDPKTGILVLQVITMPEHRYASYKRKVDFIQKHIFPGGHCPSVTALVDAIHTGSQGNLIVDKLDNIGPHYAKALRIWGERFTDTFDEIAANSGMVNVYTPSFKRKWQFYFAYCEAGFASGTLGDIQMRLTRSCNRDLLHEAVLL